MPTTDVLAITDSVDRLINIARTIDFDLLHGRAEGVAQLMIEILFVRDLTYDSDTYDTAVAVVAELERRRAAVTAPRDRRCSPEPGGQSSLAAEFTTRSGDTTYQACPPGGASESQPVSPNSLGSRAREEDGCPGRRNTRPVGCPGSSTRSVRGRHLARVDREGTTGGIHVAGSATLLTWKLGREASSGVWYHVRS
jgi:hypothetical protein